MSSSGATGMLKIKLTAGSHYIKQDEAQAIEELQQILSSEEGYIIPVVFVGYQIVNREIDAILLLSDAIFLLDFKHWDGERVEIASINAPIRYRWRGIWEERENTLVKYEYAAKEIAGQLKLLRDWLPMHPPIYPVMIFTGSASVSFAHGDPRFPQPDHGVGACHIEYFPRLLEAFRKATSKRVRLNASQRSALANLLRSQMKAAKHHRKHIDDYIVTAEHHVDAFLDCKIYEGEDEIFHQPVWLKEYKQILASPDQRNQREKLMLRHADVLLRFPQHPNIVTYRHHKSTPSHLYVILSRKPGAFLSELITQKPFGRTTQAELSRIPFDLNTRLKLLGDILTALEYLTQQSDFAYAAYRDLRPDNIFVQYDGTVPVAQLFNLDCTKLPNAITKLGHMKEGVKRDRDWIDYASPELLAYIESEETVANTSHGFTGDVRSDLFSWAVIAWELLTGELPFADTEVKLSDQRRPWPSSCAEWGHMLSNSLSAEITGLFEACLAHDPVLRPSLSTLKKHFSQGAKSC
jgi:hypothetical protein